MVLDLRPTRSGALASGQLGLFDLQGVVGNCCPARARAKLARGTLDSLDMEHVRVAVGTDATKTGLVDKWTKSVQDTGLDYLVREAEEPPADAGEAEGVGGQALLRQVGRGRGPRLRPMPTARPLCPPKPHV